MRDEEEKGSERHKWSQRLHLSHQNPMQLSNAGHTGSFECKFPPICIGDNKILLILYM